MIPLLLLHRKTIVLRWIDCTGHRFRPVLKAHSIATGITLNHVHCKMVNGECNTTEDAPRQMVWLIWEWFLCGYAVELSQSQHGHHYDGDARICDGHILNPGRWNHHPTQNIIFKKTKNRQGMHTEHRLFVHTTTSRLCASPNRCARLLRISVYEEKVPRCPFNYGYVRT